MFSFSKFAIKTCLPSKSPAEKKFPFGQKKNNVIKFIETI